MDIWDEVVEKVVDAKVKASLQPSSGTREINSRCPRAYKPSAKKDKDNANWEYWNEIPKDKAKSHNSFFANQPQTQASKKDKRGRRGDHSATGVNAIKVAKKDKYKAKDLSHIKCYICKQKGHYTNKCPKKSKNYWQSRRPPRR